MNKHQIAYDYYCAKIVQRAAEDQVGKAFAALGSDNQIFGLAEPIETAYDKLVEQLLGPELWDWLQWWMYETDNGTLQMHFKIDGVEYDPTQMTLYKFLGTVDAGT